MRLLAAFAVALALRGLLAPAETLVGGRYPHIPEIRLDALLERRPAFGDTLALIRRHGPFPYRQDDTVFTNVQRYLPPRERDAYREYTVLTPGAPDRGARRIVTGGPPRRRPGEFDALYYTDDHYSTFWLVRTDSAEPRP